MVIGGFIPFFVFLALPLIELLQTAAAGRLSQCRERDVQQT